jgi:hypothetical protein
MLVTRPRRRLKTWQKEPGSSSSRITLTALVGAQQGSGKRTFHIANLGTTPHFEDGAEGVSSTARLRQSWPHHAIALPENIHRAYPEMEHEARDSLYPV